VQGKPRPRTTAPSTPHPDSSSPVDSARQREGLGAAGTPSQPDTQAAAAPVRDPYHTAPLDTVDAKTYQGWKYYNLNCARCHGEDVGGTTIAPHLIQSLKPDGTIPDESTFQTTVCGGRVEKGMPAWCQLGMTPGQIDTIYSYVKGRSDARLHPGRPARRQ
jgi:mono/diheme cytochrome c family protein